MEYLKYIFTYVPYAVFLVTMPCFVLRLRTRWFWKLALTIWLLFCCSKFLAFSRFGGGHVYEPDLPDLLIWFWNWAYSGSMILGALSVVFFFRFRFKGPVLLLAAWTISLCGLWSGVRPPDVRSVDLVYDDLPSELVGYRIVQVSDLHASTAARRWRTQAVVDTVNALGADLVCLTGDFVDGDPERYHDILEPIRDLRAKDGVWSVTGNHEWFVWHSGWFKWFERWNVRFLANACVFPRRSLALGGVHDFRVRDPQSGKLRGPYPDVAKTFAAATNGEFRVLLQHQPIDAHANLAGHGVRLQLSGHTHGRSEEVV